MIGRVNTGGVTLFYQGGACQPRSVTVSAGIRDASGIASVFVFFRAVDGSPDQPYDSKGMSAQSSNFYSASVMGADLPPLSAGSDRTIEVYIRATDNQGNVANTNVDRSVSVRDCRG